MPEYTIGSHSDDRYHVHVARHVDEPLRKFDDVFDVALYHVTDADNDTAFVESALALQRIVDLANAAVEIHAQLTAREWCGADDLQRIAETLTAAGLPIAPPAIA